MELFLSMLHCMSTSANGNKAHTYWLTHTLTLSANKFICGPLPHTFTPEPQHMLNETMHFHNEHELMQVHGK
jgi:hypothetical protein